MDEATMRRMMAGAVAVVVNELTDVELVALHLVAVTDGSPHGRIFNYEAVKPLFTEQDGTRMHDETKIALGRAVSLRGLSS